MRVKLLICISLKQMTLESRVEKRSVGEVNETQIALINSSFTRVSNMLCYATLSSWTTNKGHGAYNARLIGQNVGIDEDTQSVRSALINASNNRSKRKVIKSLVTRFHMAVLPNHSSSGSSGVAYFPYATRRCPTNRADLRTV